MSHSPEWCTINPHFKKVSEKRSKIKNYSSRTSRNSHSQGKREVCSQTAVPKGGCSGHILAVFFEIKAAVVCVDHVLQLMHHKEPCKKLCKECKLTGTKINQWTVYCRRYDIINKSLTELLSCYWSFPHWRPWWFVLPESRWHGAHQPRISCNYFFVRVRDWTKARLSVYLFLVSDFFIHTKQLRS
jgi:hypothetical protein